MEDEQVTKLLSIVENGAKYVENISGTVWDMMVLGTRVEGFIIVGLCILVWGLVLKFAKPCLDKLVEANENYGNEGTVVYYGCLLVAMCVAFVVSCVAFYGGVLSAAAPQYYILKQILF